MTKGQVAGFDKLIHDHLDEIHANIERVGGKGVMAIFDDIADRNQGKRGLPHFDPIVAEFALLGLAFAIKTHPKSLSNPRNPESPVAHCKCVTEHGYKGCVGLCGMGKDGA